MNCPLPNRLLQATSASRESGLMGFEDRRGRPHDPQKLTSLRIVLPHEHRMTVLELVHTMIQRPLITRQPRLLSGL